MIVILSQINGVVRFNEKQFEDLKKKCNRYNVTKFHKVTTKEKLLQIVNENISHKVLLFSNYPPNSSYPKNYKENGNTTDSGAWIADSYNISRQFFEQISVLPNLQGILFITGAPKDMVSDENLTSINSEMVITITRITKRNKTNSNHDYLYRDLIVEFVTKILKYFF